MKIRAPPLLQPPSEFALAKKQIILGLAAIFAIYVCSTYFSFVLMARS
jgi:hypothetical protein